MRIKIFETIYGEGQKQFADFVDREDIQVISIHTAAGGNHVWVKHYVTVVYKYTEPK